MKTPAPYHQWDEGMVRIKEGPARDTVNSVYREFGWPGFREAFNSGVTYEERRIFAESVGLPRLYNAIARRLEVGMRDLEKQCDEIKGRMKKIQQLIDAEPIAFFTGRDFRGLPENLKANLKTLFKVLGNKVGDHLMFFVTGKQAMIRETEVLGDAVHLWARDRCHTFFIGDQMMDSLMETDIHGEFSLLETKWPMESFGAVFPYAVPVDLERMSNGQVTGEEIIGMVMACPRESSETITIDSTSSNRLGWGEPEVVVTLDPGVPTLTLFTKDRAAIVPDADKLEGPLKAFLFTLLHVWVEKPELIERGHRLGQKVSRKPGGTPAWSPNYIGRTYVTPERHEGSGEDDTRWRVRRKVRGHFKWQPYGEGRKLRKRIFIEPYWAGSIEL